MKKIVYLQSIGEVEQKFLVKLKKDLEWVLKGFIKSVEFSQNSIPLYDSEYDSIRRKYDASRILVRLKEIFQKSDQMSILGVMDEDIYSHFHNFVFGVAETRFLNRPGMALISVTRLKEQFYRRLEDDALLELRTLKEAFHELGHTFGLKHCENHCIMRFSKRLAITDEKPPLLCESCLGNVKNFFSKIL